MNDFIPLKTKTVDLFSPVIVYEGLLAFPYAPVPNISLILSADSNYKLYSFVWNELKSVFGVVTFFVLSPGSAT